ncbi:MAG: histidine phosphatase family protein [Oligosphaeraceae bacterium]
MDTFPLNPDAIRILLIRHGETRENLKGVLQGQQEGELNRTGLRQATALAEALYRAHLDACYVSDLARAVDTAAIILAAGHRELQPVLEPGLREWSLGELEGRPHQEIRQSHPELMRAFHHEPEQDFPVPGGESPRRFRQRVWECLDRLARQHQPGQQILLVTHGATLGKIFQLATGPLPPGNHIPLPDNASLSILQFFPGENAWQLVAWNQTSHLKGLPSHPTLV